MSAPRTPYQDTSVPIERSQRQIRDMLLAAKAVGVQFEETWEKPITYTVRFAWPIGESVQRVRLTVEPLADKRTAKVTPQRERQAWRGLYFYLKTMLEATQFGLLKFEDVLLSFFEDANGQTIGEHIIPMLEAGRLQLPEGGA